MKRTSGRIGVGLVLVSTLVGACLSEQERGDALAAAVTQPEAVVAPALEARDVVLAVREQIERLPGKSHLGSVAATGPLAATRDDIDLLGGRAVTTKAEAIAQDGLSWTASEAKANVVLPNRANGAFRVHDELSGLSVEVGLVGTTDAAREDVDGYTVYRGGYAGGAHVLHRTTPLGTEDYVYFSKNLPSEPALRYEVALGQGVAGLRFVGQTLEMLDARGVPRLRMAPPYAVDGDGRRIALNVAIEGCAYDSSAALPLGRPTTDPGAKNCTLRLSWGSDAKLPLVVDPAWSLTKNMNAARFNAAALHIPQVENMTFVSGGEAAIDGTVLSSTEYYVPDQDTWIVGPTMKVPRTRHAIAFLQLGPATIIMAIGGKNDVVLDSYEKCQLGASAAWEGPLPFPEGRMNHTATSMAMVVNTAPKPTIVVAGGDNANGEPLKTSFFYDTSAIPPAWSAPQMMSTARSGHTATLIADKKLLVVGGKTLGGTSAATAEICEGSMLVNNSCWVAPSTLKVARRDHVALRLPDGRVLVAGGSGALRSAEIYTSGTWMPTGDMNVGRSFFAGGLVGPLALQKPVVAGGIGAANAPIATTEVYDAATGKWSLAKDMANARAYHRATQTTEGRVLFIGGVAGDAATAEVVHCAMDAECQTGEYCAADGFCRIQKQKAAECNTAAGADCWTKDCAVCATGQCVDGFCCDAPCSGVCEACNSTAPGHTPGTCLPIAGKPVHGNCEAPDGNAKCNGQCGGFERETCVYPEGKPCGTQCNNAGTDTLPSTVQSLTCNEIGACAPSGFESSCGVFKCSTMAPVCNTECKTDGDCIGGKKCDLPTKSCVEAQVRCSVRDNTMPGLPPKEEVVESSADPHNVTERCGAFRCDQQKSECLKFCNTIYDCFDGFTCNTSNVCVKKETAFPNTVDEATSCSTSPAHESSRYGWLAALALAGALATRRNRPRA